MISRHALRPAADADIDELCDYLSAESAELALRFYDQFQGTVERLKQWPGMGRTFESDEPRLQELRRQPVDGFPNHMIYYLVRADVLLIVRVLHAARDRDAILGHDDLT